ncbi:ACT domain-containing protein [Candidatus Micrarchaeota archaeon]|nr:ACT domain-containing protein [Candidatus Micrarchaeota archaeon]MBU1165425.1 ACT domain-containing protein [Candidatus Micrarchaeota archaeon]MBU1886972.1 ACT domain-containing protein [Candidatus Micrarchaeota archaeon]
MKELIVIAGDSVGSLASVAEALGSVGVNIEAISAYGIDHKAVFRIITGDASSAMKVLSKLNNTEIRESDILLYKMINRPGELGKITRKLAEKSINLESLYIVSRKQDYTEIAIKPATSDIDRAKEILGL